MRTLYQIKVANPRCTPPKCKVEVVDGITIFTFNIKRDATSATYLLRGVEPIKVEPIKVRTKREIQQDWLNEQPDLF